MALITSDCGKMQAAPAEEVIFGHYRMLGNAVSLEPRLSFDGAPLHLY